MVIYNTTTGIRVSVDREDIGIDIEKLSLVAKVGNGFIILKRYETGEEMMKGFNHILAAYENTKELNNIVYQIK